MTVEASQNSTAKRVSAAVIAAALLLVFFLAGAFIALESDHECEGENCPVCECLEQCGITLRQLGMSLAKPGVSLFTFFFLITGTLRYIIVVCRQTLVSNKVRLND